MANSRLNNELIEAIEKCDSQKVSKLLLDGADTFAEDTCKRPALCKAASNGDLASVKALLDAGADIEILSVLFSMERPLICAAQYAYSPAHLKVAEELLDRNAEIDATASNGMSALFHAACRLYLPMVELLLRRGATVDLPNRDGETPLKRIIRDINGSLGGQARPAGWMPSPKDFDNYQSKGFLIAQVLVAYGADIDKCGYKSSPVVALLKQYREEMLKKSEEEIRKNARMIAQEARTGSLSLFGILPPEIQVKIASDTKNSKVHTEKQADEIARKNLNKPKK